MPRREWLLRIVRAVKILYRKRSTADDLEARLEAVAGRIQAAANGILRCRMAVIVQWQNAGLWIRMSWVRPPLAAPVTQENSLRTEYDLRLM